MLHRSFLPAISPHNKKINCLSTRESIFFPGKNQICIQLSDAPMSFVS